MPSTLRMLFAVLLMALPLVACSSQGSNLPLVEQAAKSTGEYRLGAGDKLHIAVVGADDLTGDYSVGDSGTIGMPLIGDIKAGGKTRGDVEKEIVGKLAAGYIKAPKVSVSVLGYRPFYIYGEVTKPGEYAYAAGMRVRSAVATAGGYTYRANETYVILSRGGQEHKALPDTVIQPDDVLKVPERFF